MRITAEQLKKMVQEAVKSKLQEQGYGLVSELSSLDKEVLPGSGNMADLAKKVDDFLMKTAEEAKELVSEMEEEMKVDVLGGDNPSLAPRIGERNRMLADRAGVLKKLASSAVSCWELLRRNG